MTYWNALVANLEMHGRGNFDDDRLDDAQQFPVAAKNRFGHVRNRPDLITPKLPALHFYQLALPAPKPPKGSVRPRGSAPRPRRLRRQGRLPGLPHAAHRHPARLEPRRAEGDLHRRLHRQPLADGRYRTTPLAGLFARSKGGFYHDGRFPTLRSVVEHYDSCHKLKLTGGEKGDLVEYLRSG